MNLKVTCTYLNKLSLRRASRLLLGGVILLCASCGSGSSGGGQAEVFEQQYPASLTVDQEVVDRLNAHRVSRGLPAQVRHRGLDALAEEHARKMLQKGKLTHSNLDYLEQVALRKYEVGGLYENILRAGGVSGPEIGATVANGWINSKGHRFNVEVKNTHIGVAVVFGANGTLYAAHFTGTPRAINRADENLLLPGGRSLLGGGEVFW